MRTACLLPIMALAACATAAAPPASAPPQVAEPAVAAPEATCRNEPLAAFAGKLRSEALGRQMLSASKAKTLRWVPPGTMVTMDFREDRLTVHLDAANRIERARCG